jgi:hypothetical protein
MEKLCVGMLSTLVQNTIYALPARRCLLFTSTAAPTIQQSNSPTFADNVAVTLTGGQAELAGAFIRVTTAGPTIVMLTSD